MKALSSMQNLALGYCPYLYWWFSQYCSIYCIGLCAHFDLAGSGGGHRQARQWAQRHRGVRNWLFSCNKQCALIYERLA